MNFQEIRQKYPQYNDMSDDDFATKFHQKFYGDMSFEDFSSKVGYSVAAPKEDTNYAREFVKGAVGTGAAALDLVAGLPKAIGSTIAAPIISAVTGDPEQSRKTAQEYAEKIIGTPSKGLAGLGVPEEYLTQSKPFESVMYPFEKMSEGIEYAGNKAADLTGSQALGGVIKQGLDMLGLALPIPGGRLAKRHGGKVLDKFVKDPNAKELRSELGYDKPEPTTDFRKAFEETLAKEAEVPSTQMELDLGQPNQFGQRPSEFVLDENGIPVRQEATLDAQTTARGGDLFSEQNIMQQGISENIANWEMPNEARGAVPDRNYLKQQEVEQAYMEKAKQDAAIPEEVIEMPSQGSTTPTQVKLTGRPQGLNRGMGKYQGGAVDTSVFLGDFPEFAASIVKGAAGKLAEVYHGAIKPIAGAFKTQNKGLNLNEEFGPYAGDLGSWFSSTPKGTDTFAGTRSGASGGNVYPAYLNIQKPKVFNTYKEFNDWLHDSSLNKDNYKYEHTANYLRRQLIKDGYDGIQIKESRTDGGGLRTDWVAFHPEQIQSSISPAKGGKQMDVTKPFGEHKTTELGDVIMSESAKEPGKYQVTFFDGKADAGAIPTQDYVFKTKAEAMKAFEEAGPSVLGKEAELPPNLRGEQELYGGMDIKRLMTDLESIYNDVKPKNLEEFLTGVRQAGLNVTDQAAEIMFNGLKGEAAAQELNQRQNVLSSFGKKVSPEFDKYMSVWKDKTPQEATDIIKASKDADTPNLGVYHSVLGTRGRLGAQKVKNDGVRNGLAYLSQVFEDARLAGNQLLSSGENSFNNVTRKLETIFGAGDAAEVFKQLGEKQRDPNYQFRLKPSQQKMLDSIKKVTDTTWDMIIEQVSKLNPEKAERLKGMKQEWYLPHSWSGDFVSYVRDADGRLLSFIAERTERGAREAAQHLRSELGSEYLIDDPVYSGNKTKQLGKKSTEGKFGADVQEAFAGQFEMLIDMLGSEDPAVQKAMSAVQSVINRRAMSAEGMKQHLKQNTNVGGHLGEKGWKTEKQNYFDMKKSFQSYVENAYSWKGKMDGAEFLSMLKEQAPDKVNTYATLRDQFMQNTNPLREVSPTVQALESSFAKTGYSPKEIPAAARKLSNFITLQQVGFGNVIQMVQNYLQSPATQLWRFGNQVAHGGNMNPIHAGANMLSSLWEGMTAGHTNPKWLEYARAHEIDKMGLVETPERTKFTAGLKGAAAYNIKATEGMSRIGYFFATTKNLIKNGYPEAQALEMAKNITRDDMGNMERHAKPGIVSNTGTMGELLGRLQSYTSLSFEMFTQTMLDAAEGIKTANPKLLLPMAGYLYAQYLTGGVNGTIPMDIAEKSHWLAVKAKVVPPEWRSPRQYMLEEHKDAAISPVSRFGPMWVEGSFRNNLPFMGAPVVQMATKKAPAMMDALQWVYSLADPSKEPSALQKATVLREALPASLRGVSEQNYMKTDNGTIVTPSGRASYQPKDDTRKLGIYSNVRTPEHGFSSEHSNLATSREFRVSDAKKDLEKSFTDKTLNITLGQKLDKEYVNKTLKRYIELGGDSTKLLETAINKAVLANYPNHVVVQLINAEKDPMKQQRLAKTYNEMRKGVR